MHKLAELSGTKEDVYTALVGEAQALVAGESDMVANAANLSSLVYHSLPDLNWVGFYFHDGTELVVGPFQGRPACIRIPLGKGVCGTAALAGETQVVPDVSQFAGHIACDPHSRSEIVVPLHLPDGTLVGVLDVDAPIPDRFDDADRAGMEAVAAVFMEAVGASRLPSDP